MFEHLPEHAFRVTLFLLTLIIYATRVWYVVKSQKSVRPSSLSFWVMTLWSFSLLAYVFGVFISPLHLGLPTSARWLGALLMLISYPLAWIRMFNSVGGYFSSRINLGAYVFADFGWHRLSWNPMFITFCLCAAGAVLLSANSLVVATSALAVVAMGTSMKKEFRALA